MSDHWTEYQRRRWMQPNAHLWMRPDAKRWLAPNQRVWQGPRNWDAKAYNPDQPRVPAGNPDGGQWTGEGGGSSPSQSSVDANGTSDGLVRLAGEIPTPDTPEVPNERPPTTRELNTAARRAATRFGPSIWTFLEVGHWLYERRAEINSFFDAPKSLDELQSGASDPPAGYDVHHIVEQTAAERDGFSREQIDDPENLVLVPRWKHWFVNAWYQRKQEEFGGLSARDYLRGQPWDVRRSVGLRALIDLGILQP